MSEEVVVLTNEENTILYGNPAVATPRGVITVDSKGKVVLNSTAEQMKVGKLTVEEFKGILAKIAFTEPQGNPPELRFTAPPGTHFETKPNEPAA